MVLGVLALCALLVAIWWLTGGSFGRFGATRADRKTATEVLSLAKGTSARADELVEMLTRMGLDGNLAREALREMGFEVEMADAPVAPPGFGLVRRPIDVAQSLVDAMLVGIQAARLDDDYARMGDDFLDEAALSRRVEHAEAIVFGDDRRRRLALLGKAVLVLQDMVQDESDEERRVHIAELLSVFDVHLAALQKEMAEAMAQVPDGDGLLWGDSRDRRFYYFKMGVTNTLRQTGSVKSLGHLYKVQGVNYNVEEAFQLAAQECPPLALADRAGIDHVIRLEPADVQSWVQRALSDGTR